MHHRIVTAFNRTNDPTLLKEINAWRQRDPRWYGPPGADLWKCTNTEAKSLVRYEGPTPLPVASVDSIVGELVRVTESGREGLRRNGMRVASGFLPAHLQQPCSSADSSDHATLTCEFKFFASAEMLHDSYAMWVQTVRTAVTPRGWTEHPEESIARGRETSFQSARGDELVTVSYREVSDIAQAFVRVRFQAYK